ncbi:aminotransferase class V-fold PLP-dependent enzyme [Fusibacter sp. JL216-2]|uniref:aminotransferase class V-fold PLP-dependent enzyme n=1 Tax=Fusibacter sp. JL216-2 TaxID=3071453 RepID=UPI003D329111
MKFHDIDVCGLEEEYVLSALRSGNISGRGPNTLAVESYLQKTLKAKRVLMTTSCTHALEMAVRLGGIKEGDEVLLPSYTFPSTANAVLAVGATPILIPVEKNNLCVSLSTIKKYTSKRTRAVIAVHYGGVCNDIDAIAEHCDDEKIILIEDAAQAYGSVYKNKKLGTFGHMGCYSFHGTKNDVSGEGGALVINKDKDGLISQAERLLEKGTDRMAFMRGEAAKYEWKGYGSSYVPSDILMALLRGQLETSEMRMERRREIIKAYTRTFSNLECEEVTFLKVLNWNLNKIRIKHLVKALINLCPMVTYTMFFLNRQKRPDAFIKP